VALEQSGPVERPVEPQASGAVAQGSGPVDTAEPDADGSLDDPNSRASYLKRVTEDREGFRLQQQKSVTFLIVLLKLTSCYFFMVKINI
jgi:hypothetical protein